MPDYEKDNVKQRTLFWERFRLYNENERSEKTKEVHRWAAIYYRYKLSRREWQAIFDNQKGCCAICGVTQEKLNHPLEIDFDRATGKVRGLLCRKCNSGIGHLGEDVERLRRAIRYLESRVVF